MDLKNKNWNEFEMGKIFKIYATSSGIDKNKLENHNGRIPYVTRTNQTNGYDLFIGKQLEKYQVNKKNVITIGLDTQTIFYQQTNFYTGQNIQILEFKELNEHVAMFIIPLLKKQMMKFNWGGNGATLTRLKKAKILLPSNAEGDPDYDFMETYTKHLKRVKEQNYLDYISRNIEGLKGISKPAALKDKKWEVFLIGKLFKLTQGKSKGLNHLNRVEYGGVNYLGATNSNNGVIAFIKEEARMLQKGNCICFIRNGEGSMGYAIYKKEDFIATSDISAGYSKFLNKHVGLFITTIADKVRGKYTFGYKRSDTRLQKEKILLPVQSDGEPDYAYMENYMKYQEYQKLEQYLNFKSSEVTNVIQIG
ncbi:hypothetical protein GCM10023093_26150 [Nemorincola caseinilytica]|uniref:Type I restriction modification DNA specificity domain-containing protein n=1 Tax=Nemorincola caseinilytica TaxID=2054315 RepID=A0ABP8NNG2_9BACT